MSYLQESRLHVCSETYHIKNYKCLHELVVSCGSNFTVPSELKSMNMDRNTLHLYNFILIVVFNTYMNLYIPVWWFSPCLLKIYPYNDYDGTHCTISYQSQLYFVNVLLGRLLPNLDLYDHTWTQIVWYICLLMYTFTNIYTSICTESYMYT